MIQSVKQSHRRDYEYLIDKLCDTGGTLITIRSLDCILPSLLQETDKFSANQKGNVSWHSWAKSLALQFIKNMVSPLNNHEERDATTYTEPSCTRVCLLTLQTWLKYTSVTRSPHGACVK